MEIINVHTHIWKKPFGKITKFKLKDLADDMAENGINKSLILAVAKDIWEQEYSVRELAELVKNDKRFGIIATINIKKSISVQKKEIEELIKKGIAKGVKIYLGYQYIFVSDKRLKPIYDLCIKYDCPIIFHTGDALLPNAKVCYSHPLQIDSLAVDYPKLKIIISHLGNPWTVDVAEILYKNKNVYGDISGLFTTFVDERYNKDTIARINSLIAYSGGKKLLFGTDFPLVSSKDYLKFVDMLNLNKDEKEFLLYKNAKELFKL